MNMPRISLPGSPVPMPVVDAPDCGDRMGMEQPIITMEDDGREFFRLSPNGTLRCAHQDYEKALIQLSAIFLRAVR